MSDVTINYKGSSIATMDASGTKTLLTEGKYCEDDIEVVYVKSGGGGTARTAADVTIVDISNILSDDEVLNAYVKNTGQVLSSTNDRVVIISVKPSTGYTFVWNRVSIGSTDDSGLAVFTSKPAINSTGRFVTSGYISSGQTVTFTTSSTETYVAVKIAQVQRTKFSETLAASTLIETPPGDDAVYVSVPDGTYADSVLKQVAIGTKQVSYTTNGTFKENVSAYHNVEITVDTPAGAVDNIIGNTQFSSFTNTTYSGSNLILSRIPAIDITVENATGLAQSGGFNANTTGIISIPKVTTCGASTQSVGLKAKVLYAPLMTNLGSNPYTNDCQNLIKLVLGTHPIANTSSSGSLRYATTNFKALVIKATTPPTLSDAALTRLRDYTGIGTNADGYIYVPTSAYNDYISATNWSTISSKIRKIGDYPLIDAPTTWLPT